MDLLGELFQVNTRALISTNIASIWDSRDRIPKLTTTTLQPGHVHRITKTVGCSGPRAITIQVITSGLIGKTEAGKLLVLPTPERVILAMEVTCCIRSRALARAQICPRPCHQRCIPNAVMDEHFARSTKDTTKLQGTQIGSETRLVSAKTKAKLSS